MKPALKIVSTSAFRIEKGVPITTQVRGTILYPFADMAKGDSFLVPTSSPKGATARLQRRTSAGPAIPEAIQRAGLPVHDQAR
jgi:hypothetical protein